MAATVGVFIGEDLTAVLREAEEVLAVEAGGISPAPRKCIKQPAQIAIKHARFLFVPMEKDLCIAKTVLLQENQKCRHLLSLAQTPIHALLFDLKAVESEMTACVLKLKL